MNIGEIYKEIKSELDIRQIEDSSLIAKMLIAYVLEVDKIYLVAHSDEVVSSGKEKRIFRDVQKVLDGYPIQYITHHQEFMGMNFYVDENVLIPQPDTEILVEEAIKKIKEVEDSLKKKFMFIKQKASVLDLCTGSGIIGISIAKNIKSEVTASDISVEAISIARKNARENDVDVEYIKSDMFEKIDGVYEVICSNPPYIETDVIQTLSKEVKNEPRLALDGGDDGLVFYREIVENAVDHLTAGGFLLLEIGYDQKEKVISLLENNGEYEDIYCKKDYSDNDRVIVAKRK